MSEPSTEIVLAPLDLARLADPFPPTDVEWRIGQSGAKKDGTVWAKVLAYITNRAIMDRLDEVCGPGNWKNEFHRDGDAVMCGLSVRVRGEWVTKWDGAENTDIEAVKGGLSAAMKRAGVQWGIGRYLYDLEEGWADVSENGQHYVPKNDKKGTPAFRWSPPKLPSWALPQERKADANGELVLPGAEKNWHGDGGKPLSKATVEGLVECRDWYRAKGKRLQLVDAINDELEQRRSGGESGTAHSAQPGRTPVRGKSATPSVSGGKPVSPNPGATDDGQGDPPMPHAILEEDEIDALIASVERNFRDAKGVIPDGKLALMEARWKSFGANPTATQCEIMAGQLAKARAVKAPA